MTTGSEANQNIAIRRRMSGPKRAILWLVVGTTLLLAVATAYLGWLQHGPEFVGGLPWLIGNGLVPMAFGLFILYHQSQNPYGWLWVAFGAAVILMLFTQGYVGYSLSGAPSPLPLTAYIMTLVGPTWTLAAALISPIILLFPDGKAPYPIWRWVLLGVAIAYGLSAISAVLSGVEEGSFGPYEMVNPFALPEETIQALRILTTMSVGALFIAIPVSIASVFFRYRAGGQTERLQLRWFGFSAVLFLLFLISDSLYTAPGIWEGIKEAVGFNITLVAIGVAIVRYRLFDIDVIIRRTTSYAILTVLLALIYFSSIVVLQQILTPLIGSSDAAVVLSTLLIAALFLPLRRRLQAVIDRRFFRRKYDAEKVLAQFAATARDETDLDALTAELIRVIQDTMQPEYVSIWLRADQRSSASGPDVFGRAVLDRRTITDD